MKNKAIAALMLLLAIQLIPATVFAVEGEEPTLNSEYWFDQFVKFFNIALVIGVLFFLLRKPVKNFFRKRAAQIEEDIKAAEQARVEAQARLAEVEKEVAQLQEKIAEIKEIAAREGEIEKQRIIEQAREEAERLIKAAGREVENRTKAGRKELKAYAAELAVERAREILTRQLSDDDDIRLIERTIKDIGGVH